MLKQIIWSPLSEKDLENILAYLDDKWNTGIAIQFIEILNHLLKQISINPRQFPLIHKHKKVRKCVITKHNTLFYRDRIKSIDVLRIYDTRQNPKSLKFK